MKKQRVFSFCAIIVLVSIASCSQTAGTTPVVTPQMTVTPQATATAIKATVEPLNTERTLIVDGQKRSYLLHIPSGLISGAETAVVFVFHGLNETSVSIQATTEMDAVADANGFVVAYPAGYGGAWNATCCGGAVASNINDIGFIRQMIDDIGIIVPVDSKRIYATGFSNGALLTYRIACEMSDTFAAVAPVAGSLVTHPCEPQEAVSLIHMHGMQDDLVPYEGGPSPVVPDLVFLSVPESVATWAKLDGCNDLPDVKKEGLLIYTNYSNCKPGVGVELITSEVGTHGWPSKYVMTPPLSEIIWEFFSAHPKP